MSEYRGPATALLPNGQPIEKMQRTSPDGSLAVHSIFSTIQGEGPFCGHRALFIRLAGCNLQCPRCDTEYSAQRENYTVDELCKLAVAATEAAGRESENAEGYDKRRLVVITGGEPFRQPIGGLINALFQEGFYVQVESNGTLPPSPEVTWSHWPSRKHGAYLVCSPKTGKVNPQVEKAACCYKYVASHDDLMADGLPSRALGHSANPHLARPPHGFTRPIYLQPADHQDPVENSKNLRAVVDSCLKHGYIVQLQIHKTLNVE